MEQNIIFLDFDGVLNNNVEDITLESVMLLRYMIQKKQARVVVISSRLQNGTPKRKEKITTFLNKLRIFDIDFIDPNFKGHFHNKELSRRILGIIDYINIHPNINYVILDDETDKEYRILRLNYYKTDMWEGLKYDDYHKINFEKPDFSRIREVSYQYRDLGPYEKETNILINVMHLIREKKNQLF